MKMPREIFPRLQILFVSAFTSEGMEKLFELSRSGHCAEVTLIKYREELHLQKSLRSDRNLQSCGRFNKTSQTKHISDNKTDGER